MLRPYSKTVAIRKSKRSSGANASIAMLLLGLAAIMTVVIPDLSSFTSSSSRSLRGVVRRLTANCITNMYATPETAMNLPDTLQIGIKQQTVPAYIHLCYEWVRREAYPNQAAEHAQFLRTEDQAVCTDWTSPHFSMLDMLSASMVAAMLPHGRYQHNCGDSRVWDEDVIGCDHTTLQQAFPNHILAVDHDVTSRAALFQQCKAALMSYNPYVESSRIKAYAYHHPFIWPEQPSSVIAAEEANAEQAQLPPDDLSRWIQVYGTGTESNEGSEPSFWQPGSPYVNRPVFYIRRICPTCSVESHKNIVYKRLTGITEEFNAEDLFLSNWFNAGNVLNEDFELYGSMEDALEGINSWQYCNYNDPGIGFPRDCGPEKFTASNWNSLTRGGQSNYAYYVWKENTEATGPAPLAMPTKPLEQGVDLSQWIQVYGRGTEENAASTDSSKWAVGSEYVTNPIWYVRRFCPTCASEAHKDIVYKRISAISEDFDAADLFLSNWFNTNNFLNQDFELYGSMEEAVDGLNPWQYCNYNDPGIGFPRDCGPEKFTASNWNSLTRGGQSNYAYYVWKGNSSTETRRLTTGVETIVRPQDFPMRRRLQEASSLEEVKSTTTTSLQSIRSRVQPEKTGSQTSLSVEEASSQLQSSDRLLVSLRYDACQTLDFEFVSDGTKLSRGAYVSEDFLEKWGVVVTADASNRDKGFTPNGFARIFDSSNPGTSDANGDPDLGSPNEKCDVEGSKPGQGGGGYPGQIGENCVPLGNILVIQEEDTDYPNDNASGGQLAFDFSTPTFVEHIGLVDIENPNDYLEVLTVDGAKYNIDAAALGDNSVQKLSVKTAGVVRMVLHMQGSGGVSELGLCYNSVNNLDQTVPDYTAPLVGIVTPLRSRLEQTSIDFMNVTHAPPMEFESGVLIYVDPTAIGVTETIYTKLIRADLPFLPTSISIMTSPSCMTTNLPTGQRCKDYVYQVYKQLKSDFKEVGSTGFEGGEGINYEIACSTAGSASRMMRARMLICPPGSPSCLLPAMGKYGETSSILMETEDLQKPSEFFAVVGYNDRVKMIQLLPSDYPALSEGPIPPASPKTSTGEPAASIYLKMNDQVDRNGFPTEASTSPQFTSVATAILTSAKACLDMIGSLTTEEVDPLAKEDRVELIPTPGDILKALSRGLPLDMNYLTPAEEHHGGLPKLVSQQLGTDDTLGFKTRSYSPVVFAKQAQERQDSIARIQAMNRSAKSEIAANTDSVNPLLNLEVWCPAEGSTDPADGTPTGNNEDESIGARRLRRLQKKSIPAHEFRFAPDTKHLCRHHRRIVDADRTLLSRSEHHALEHRRKAAISHAIAKRAARPKVIDRRRVQGVFSAY